MIIVNELNLTSNPKTYFDFVNVNQPETFLSRAHKKGNGIQREKSIRRTFPRRYCPPSNRIPISRVKKNELRRWNEDAHVG